MTTLKERAAKAIDELGFHDFVSPRESAEAALAAIAEPSDAMIEAGENAGCGVSDFRTAAELTWRAMHAAMMAEKDTRK